MTRIRYGLAILVGGALLINGLWAVAVPADGEPLELEADAALVLAPADDRVIVRFENATDVEAATAVLNDPRYRITRPLMPHVGLFLVGIEGTSVERAVEELSALPGVRFAQPDHPLQDRSTYPNDPYFYKQWNMHNVGENGLAFKEDGSCQFNCSQVATTSCVGSCGGKSPDGCWCDNVCETDSSDCCDDYGAECGTSCVGSCGGNSPDGCWCDSSCVSNGDCCSDYEKVCAPGPSPPTGDCGCTSECVDGKNCCWDACAQCGTCSGKADSDVDAPQAWDKGTSAVGDTEVVIALVDSGFDVDHTDLESNIWKNTLEDIGSWGFDDDGNGYKDDYHGWNADYGDGVIVPAASGHGTKVLGVAGAVGNNGKGVSGIAWNAKMMLIVKGSGSNTWASTVVAGYEYVRVQKQKWLDTNGTQGANVVVTSNSFGVFGSCLSQYAALQTAYEELGAVGILSVAAAANEEVNQDQQLDVPSGCPSDYVIAVTNLNSNDQLFYAGYGKQTVDLGAPGEDVYTTVPDHEYDNFYGTSAATPLVAGAIGLVHALAPQCFKDFARDNPSAAALFMKDTILSNVDNVSSLLNKTVSGGRLNVYKAIQDIQYPASFECGDGCCHSAESYSSCPTDCEQPVVCGDGICTDGETVSSCKQDCAGNATCCLPHAGPGCDNLAVQNCVCSDSLGSSCCSGDWTELCSAIADTCGSCSGDCCAANATPGCMGTGCDGCVCNLDLFCCDVEWDDFCASLANGLCIGSCDVCEVCGNGSCGEGEATTNCPADCGTSGIDGVCNGGETKCTAPFDCGGECVQNSGQGQGCGLCGTKMRYCNDDCTWGPWNPCTGQGVCNPGTTTSQACGDCGVKTATCTSSCAWPGFSSCGGSGPCNDGDGCTVNDTCSSSGSCNGSAKVCDDGNSCTSDSCSGGSCQFTNNGNSCNDGDACSLGDSCSGGVCSGSPKVCDDGNFCTNDSCSGGNCQFTNNGNSCNDGDACTLNDGCSGGSCQGSVKVCDDGNACTSDSCSGGNCQFTNNGNACSDGDPCTLGDICTGGACEATPKVCDDDNVCTSDSCSGGDCKFTNNGNSCTDGDACTLGDGCSGGACVGTPKACVDGNACTSDSCVGGDCKFTNTTDPCDDGSACTLQDACVDGGCQGVLKVCDDDNACTNDGCVAGNCKFTNNSNSCSDGDACTLSDGCSGGSCSGTPKVCVDGNACTSDSCVGGNCQFSNTTDSCDDGDACSLGDTCAGGACVGTAKVCVDGNECTSDSCVDGECVFSEEAASDQSCTTNSDVCTAGACSEGACVPTAGSLCTAHVDPDDVGPPMPCSVDLPGACTDKGECIPTAGNCESPLNCTLTVCCEESQGLVYCLDGDFDIPCIGDCGGKECGDNGCGGSCGGCGEGFECDGSGSCANVDECALGLDDCDPNATCTDTAGGYLCTCDESLDAWQGDWSLEYVETCKNSDMDGLTFGMHCGSAIGDKVSCDYEIGGILTGSCDIAITSGSCNSFKLDYTGCTLTEPGYTNTATVSMDIADSASGTFSASSGECGTVTISKKAPLSGACCETSTEPGCPETPFCEACVCGLDSFCCDSGWDFVCALIATAECKTPCECGEPCVPACGDKECGDDGCGGTCGECGDGGFCTDDGDCIEDPVFGKCCEPSDDPGCAETPFCEACVCGQDSFCCNNSWDTLCAGIATGDCETPCECDVPCLPQCEGLNCGDNGCEGSCGTCSGDQGCAQGVCTDPCPLVNLCLESPGDVNGDGTTDISDVQCGIVAALWELAGSFGAMPMCCKGEWWRTDMNCDQGTNIVDVLMGINMALKIPMAAGLDADGNGCPDACQAAPDPGCDILFDE